MPRARRCATGGVVYHVLNRANGSARMFGDAPDYAAFESILIEAHERVPLRILAYCLMPNHWHLVLWPFEQKGEDLSTFMHWLSLTHTSRRHAYLGITGSGHLYQGRFKSFPVQEDGHFLAVCRYIERNALRAGLVARAEDWRWSSLWRRLNGSAEQRKLLTGWPVERPPDWTQRVNQPETKAELEIVRLSIQRGRPCGDIHWTAETAKRLGLESTLKSRGRPWLGNQPIRAPDRP